MVKKKLLTAILAAAVMVTSIADGLIPAGIANAAEPVEVSVRRTEISNPILSEYPDNDKVPDANLRGTVLYGGDPSVMVEGDTVYLYTGRDVPIDFTQVDGKGNKVPDGYYMFEWQCYSTKDLKNWTYEGVIMRADKESMTWTSSGTDAWAGQITYHYDPDMDKKYYYFYNCTWDATSGGQQSIGAAVADTPTGWSSLEAKKEYCEAKNIKTSIPDDDPKSLYFVDLGQPLVKGTFTTGESSAWNDIDPTVWVETVNGEEHRYLSWGNGKVFVCELNEDMISIQDVNGDGKITFGTQASGADSTKADVIEKSTANLGVYTEAPWIYRRKDAQGNSTGPYYFFYAYDWREQMAYATTDDLMNGTFTFGKILMPPTATSNTNHMAVFDFKGKTYFVYHNGSVRGGSGYRRTACITEMHFNEDGSIQEIPETAIGITGDKPYYLFSSSGAPISHENYVNSGADSAYPYLDVKIGAYYQPQKLDASWVITDGKADPTKRSYVSIQSENKPGLYMTVNDDNSVTLAHDWNYTFGYIKNGFTKPAGTGTQNNVPTFDEAMGKAQTFRTVRGLSDSAKAVSFESVKKPGYYLCMNNGDLVVKAQADCGVDADFYLNAPAQGSFAPGTGTANDITSLKAGNTEMTKDGHTYECEVPATATTADLKVTLQDVKGFLTIDGKQVNASSAITIPLTGLYTTVPLTVYSSDRKPRVTYTVIIKKSVSASDITSEVFKEFQFEDAADGAIAVQKGAAGTTPTAMVSPDYAYVEGAKEGKAIRLPGNYGLKLCDAAGLGENYSVSYWMKPEKLNGDVDPTLAAGTFSPEYWLNLTFTRAIWSNANGGWADTGIGSVAYEKDKWQLVTLVVKSGKAQLYVNGVLKAEAAIASDLMQKQGAAIYFGVNAWDAYFTGALDELNIYNNALSDVEVMAIALDAIQKPSELPQPDPDATTSSGTFSDGNVEAQQPEVPEPVNPGTEDPDPGNPDPGNPDPGKPEPKPPVVQRPKVKKVTVKAANQKPGVKTVYLKKGGKVTLTATVTGTGIFSKAVDWSTSKKSVATVSKGVVKAKKAGTAKITVKSKADKTKKASITIKVSSKAVKNKTLKLKKTKTTMKKGKTYTIAIKSMTKKTTDAVTYKSSKSSTASVDKFGVVKAKKKGKATITVKCGKKSAKLTITVK